MSFLRLVWANLMRRKLRTTLTMLSVFVAFFLFGMLCTISEAFSAGVNLAGADRLVTRHKVSLIMTLPITYGARMRALPGVDATAHWTWFGGAYQDDPKNFFGNFPVVPEEFFDLHPEYSLPQAEREAWARTRTGAIVGRSLAERFKWKVGDRVPLISPIWPRAGEGAWEFDIVGIYDGAQKQTDTSNMFFRYDYFDEARAQGKGSVGWYMVRVKDPDQATEVAAAIDAEFANSPYETKTEPEGAFAQSFLEQIGSIGTILLAVLSAVFFTILLVAGNTMAQAVRERVPELAILKTLGFKDGTVLWLVLVESVLLVGIGGLLGMALARAILPALASRAQGMLPATIPAQTWLLGLGLIVLIGLVVGVLPALRAKRLKIVDALAGR